jgi:quercetin dioxygenase-like cupin family protein
MADDVHADRREPQQPDTPLDLGAAADELIEQARGLSAGRSARTLTPGAGALLKQTLVALVEGGELDEHGTPGPATIQVLRGRATLRFGDEQTELSEGSWAPIPAAPHDLQANSDVVALLTVTQPAGATA